MQNILLFGIDLGSECFSDHLFLFDVSFSSSGFHTDGGLFDLNGFLVDSVVMLVRNLIALVKLFCSAVDIRNCTAVLLCLCVMLT